MRDVRSLGVFALLAVIAIVAAAAPNPKPLQPVAPAASHADPHAMAAWDLYDRYCLACHGYNGDGLGPAAPLNWGVARSFAAGEYKWRSTPIGQPPSDDDLHLTIRYGAPGSSMPAFDGVIAPPDIDKLVAIVKAFAPGAFAKAGTPVTLGSAPAFDADRGRALWPKSGCPACHGDDGKGDGPAMKVLPYDLTALPLRRPRVSDERDIRRRAAALSIATGMSGTAMPSYAGSIPEADLWALADFVVAQGERGKRVSNGALDPQQIEDDKSVVGAWPGSGNPDEAVLWAEPIKPQGPAPDSLAPAQASLRSRQCARCHAKQFREWNASLHSSAASPGLRAQIDVTSTQGSASCRRCHSPLAEQKPDQPGYDADLRDEGVTCAGCHVRDWTRRGPARIAASLLPAPAYPLVELAIYERGDFCMGCHQLPPRTAVAGKPLLNTYKEWLEGPYMKRGIECQHCHMPNREHTFLGVHDREIFRQGIKLTATATRKADGVSVSVELRNVGAGHMLPTTPTPAAWITIELLDDRGRAIDGTGTDMRIGRDHLLGRRVARALRHAHPARRGGDAREDVEDGRRARGARDGGGAPRRLLRALLRAAPRREARGRAALAVRAGARACARGYYVAEDRIIAVP